MDPLVVDWLLLDVFTFGTQDWRDGYSVFAQWRVISTEQTALIMMCD